MATTIFALVSSNLTLVRLLTCSQFPRLATKGSWMLICRCLLCGAPIVKYCNSEADANRVSQTFEDAYTFITEYHAVQPNFPPAPLIYCYSKVLLIGIVESSISDLTAMVKYSVTDFRLTSAYRSWAGLTV